MLSTPTLTVSVLPVPAGPSGFPPLCRYMAVVSVRTQRSVSGVTTSRPLLPWRISSVQARLRESSKDEGLRQAPLITERCGTGVPPYTQYLWQHR